MKLRDIATITQGNTPSRNHPEYWNGTIPWVPTALIQNQLITDELIEERITKTGLQKTSMKIFPKGTILMAMIGQGKTRGQIAMLDLPAAINQNAAAIILNDSVYAKYIYHQLHSKYDEIRAMSNGAGQQNLNTELIGSIDIFLPHISEQKNTAILLDYWDSAIEKTERLIELKEQQFSHLLNNLIGKPSKHWHSYSLGDLFNPITRKNAVGETNVLTSSAEYGLISQLEYYNKSVSADDVSGYYLIEQGEFAYNRSAANGYPYGAIKRLDKYPHGVLSTLYICFALKDQQPHDANFLSYYFESGALNTQLAEVCQEGARSHGLLNITKSDFFDLVLNLPSTTEQISTAKILASAESEIELLQNMLKQLNQQKSFLMSKLLTGKWEAPDLGAKAN